VLDWKGPLGEGGPAGRPSRPPSRTTPGGVGREQRLVIVIFFSKTSSQNQTVWAFWGVSTPGASVGAAVTGDFGRGGTQSALGRLKKTRILRRITIGDYACQSISKEETCQTETRIWSRQFSRKNVCACLPSKLSLTSRHVIFA